VAKVGAPAEIEPLPEPVVPGGVSQFTTLLSRRFKLFFRDTGYLGLTLAITFGFPLLVIIFNLEGAWDVLKIPMDRNTASMEEVKQALNVQMANAQLAGLAAGLVMFQVILLTLMGANNGGREISAERVLYEKERMTGLRPWAYAFSKITFVSLIAVAQGAWMCFFVKLILQLPRAVGRADGDPGRQLRLDVGRLPGLLGHADLAGEVVPPFDLSRRLPAAALRRRPGPPAGPDLALPPFHQRLLGLVRLHEVHARAAVV
jgi:hypothetical protein